MQSVIIYMQRDGHPLMRRREFRVVLECVSYFCEHWAEFEAVDTVGEALGWAALEGVKRRTASEVNTGCTFVTRSFWELCGSVAILY